MSFVPLYTPNSETELAVVRSQLDDTGIRYMIQGDNFGSQYPGAQIDSFNRRYVLVWEDDLDRAKAILGMGIQPE